MGIHINLLPVEEKVLEKEKARVTLVIRITVLIIGLIILVTAGAFGFKFFQSNQQKQNNDQLTSVTQELAVYKNQEGYLTLLRKRLVNINNLQSQQSLELASLNVIFSLLPNNIVITSISSTKKDTVLISGTAPSTDVLNSLINALTDNSINKQKVTGISIENLSRDAAGQFRFDISINVK